MRKTIIGANWKMNKTISESVRTAEQIRALTKGAQDRVIFLCIPFTALYAVSRVVAGSHIFLGAQNMYWDPVGAYTGEISPVMLKDVGCQYVMVGHSERRQYFGETDEWVNKKTKSALEHGLIPVICIGERLEQREAGETYEVIRHQVIHDLAGLNTEQVMQLIIAYEPVWAIGTGKTASPAHASEAHSFIRELLTEAYGKKATREVSIIYGGSVTPENAPKLIETPHIDGVFVGGASLNAHSFSQIVHFDR